MVDGKLQTPDFFEDGVLHTLCITITRIQPERNTRSHLSAETVFGAFAGPGLVAMKNIYEVLRSKEMDLVRLRTEVDALRIVAPMLAAEPGEVDPVHRLDLAWTETLQRNKWPLKVGHPAPSFTDS
jgi:hypothetical protein